MIVVDANIVIYLVCQTPWTDLVRQVYSADGDWIVPDLWEPEVLNGLMVMKRGGLLGLEDAIRAWSNASALLDGTIPLQLSDQLAGNQNLNGRAG